MVTLEDDRKRLEGKIEDPQYQSVPYFTGRKTVSDRITQAENTINPIIKPSVHKQGALRTISEMRERMRLGYIGLTKWLVTADHDRVKNSFVIQLKR